MLIIIRTIDKKYMVNSLHTERMIERISYIRKYLVIVHISVMKFKKP